MNNDSDANEGADGVNNSSSNNSDSSRDDFKAPPRRPTPKQGNTPLKTGQSPKGSTRMGTTAGGTSSSGSTRLPAAPPRYRGDDWGQDPNQESKAVRRAFKDQCQQGFSDHNITFTDSSGAQCVLAQEDCAMGIPDKLNSKVLVKDDKMSMWTLPKHNVLVELRKVMSNQAGLQIPPNEHLLVKHSRVSTHWHRKKTVTKEQNAEIWALVEADGMSYIECVNSLNPELLCYQQLRIQDMTQSTHGKYTFTKRPATCLV